MLPAFLTTKLPVFFGNTIKSHDLSRAVAVCATMSLLVQTMVSPTRAVMVAGAKATLVICTVTVSAAAEAVAAINAATTKNARVGDALISCPPQRARRAVDGPGRS